MSFERFEPGAIDWQAASGEPDIALPPASDPRAQQVHEAIDALECGPVSRAMSGMRWHELLKDMRHIADNWLDLALACDWTLLDLFGAPPLFAGRVQLRGVAVLMQGRPIESVDGNRIVIANRIGAANTYYRHAPGCSVPFDNRGKQLLWDVLAKVDAR